MHVENELVEIVTTDDREFKEIIEEYEEEVLVREQVLEPPPTDSANTVPAQGKPRCITSIFKWSEYIYMICIYVTGILWKLHA